MSGFPNQSKLHHPQIKAVSLNVSIFPEPGSHCQLIVSMEGWWELLIICPSIKGGVMMRSSVSSEIITKTVFLIFPCITHKYTQLQHYTYRFFGEIFFRKTKQRTFGWAEPPLSSVPSSRLVHHHIYYYSIVLITPIVLLEKHVRSMFTIASPTSTRSYWSNVLVNTADCEGSGICPVTRSI